MMISPEANEGIHAPVGNAVYSARNPEEFAARTLEFLDDPQRAEALAIEGQRFVQSHWS
jgi:hypothetical protein